MLWEDSVASQHCILVIPHHKINAVVVAVVKCSGRLVVVRLKDGGKKRKCRI